MPGCAVFISSLDHPTITMYETVKTAVVSTEKPLVSKGVLFGLAVKSHTMEVAYTETYEDLKRDACLLLEGTAGDSSIAILVKIGFDGLIREYLSSHMKVAFNPHSYSVQLYEYYSLQNKTVRKGGRKTLFPVSQNHASQKIEFMWGDILKTQLSQIQPISTEPPPLLPNNLHEIINVYTDKHVQLRNRCGN
ncbi:hypothetical protein AJ78_03578 [Emergomyces pasteurianus Ep9510]|uniref:Uncharacterized protein n=1 Tax=Emergomyces pasteurianus Ep9510 TaxID=1447872 RepID=A0A1J9PIG3_9EURO|nr:hypothetical protein AJ78_03578 [Emergomyces pasteurianus Ep9510]